MASVSIEILLILALILANGVFALSEIAVVSARKARLQQRANAGDVRARLALELANAPNDFLSAIQVGITLVGIMAGALGGATLAWQLAQALRPWPFLAPHAERLALGLVVVAITYCSLVLGELVPKRLALNDPEQIAAIVAGPMRALARVMAPIVRLLSVSTEGVLWLLRLRRADEPPITEGELQVLIAQGAEAGVFTAAEEDMLGRVLRLGDLRAGSLMTPRTEIEWLDLDEPQEVLLQTLRTSRHSRFPVAQGHLDNVLGVVLAKDLLAQSLCGGPLDFKACMRPPLFVPETASALHVLDLFKRSGETMALVIDEYGGLQGLTTVVDILEAVVGDLGLLSDESQRIARRADGSWLVDGLLSLAEFRALLGCDQLPGEEENAYQTAGGFMMSHLGRIPLTGDSFEWGGYRFEVVDMDGKRVDKILVVPLAGPDASQSEQLS